MKSKNVIALMLALGMAQVSHSATAAPGAQAVQCYKYSSQMSPGVAAPGEYKVIHSYTVKCGTTMHHLTVRTQQGSVQPVTVERLQGGRWVVVASNAYDPSANWGAGSFRVILNNRNGNAPVGYRGSFSLPL
ncbi:hypothetical protein [Pseudomonas sp. efr-133-TYG-103a]|jgi:hypothetical protein|uniref:hypothetical protein n=1 Tax=Pseudomonas sp. efr-133-TYG-103a TaxID=3040308 RepID=UPI002553C5D3|nr:hypothetical protein [Pseudomonas sp. efr-133-TYG-103a]